MIAFHKIYLYFFYLDNSSSTISEDHITENMTTKRTMIPTRMPAKNLQNLSKQNMTITARESTTTEITGPINTEPMFTQRKTTNGPGTYHNHHLQQLS